MRPRLPSRRDASRPDGLSKADAAERARLRGLPLDALIAEARRLTTPPEDLIADLERVHLRCEPLVEPQPARACDAVTPAADLRPVAPPRSPVPTALRPQALPSPAVLRAAAWGGMDVRTIAWPIR